MKYLSILILALLFISCSDSSENNDSCTTEKDCLNGYICNDNHECVQFVCAFDSDCRSGEICEKSECFTGCRNNEDCKNDKICNSETLKCEKKVTCIEDASLCKKGYICDTELKECKVNDNCMRKDDCPDNYDCLNNICEERKCTIDDSCDNGYICENTSCVRGCRINTDCPDNHTCIEKVCKVNECANNSCINFDTTIQGEENSQKIKITNKENSNLILKDFKLLDNKNFLVENKEITIEPNQSVQISVKFTPKDIRGVGDDFKTKLTIKTNRDKNLVFSLIGPATTPKIKNPEVIDFGNSVSPVDREFNLENSGLGILTINELLVNNFSDVRFVLKEPLNAGILKICPKDASNNNILCNGIPKSVKVVVTYTPDNPDESDEGNIKIVLDRSYENKNPKSVYIGLTANIEMCKLTLYATNATVVDNTIDLEATYINGEYKKENIFIFNRGGKPCKLKGVKVIDESEAFKLELTEDFPADGIILAKRDSYLFKVLFKPDAEINYSAILRLKGDDPRWEGGETDFELRGIGSTAIAPIAICGDNAEANGDINIEVEPSVDNPSNPVSVISLKGSNSTPSGHLNYKWEKIIGPEGSVALPRNPNAADTKYFVDLSGDHQLRLTVTNDQGVSDSCNVNVKGITSNALHVELFWDTNGDIDLHFKRQNTTDSAWGTNDDCYFKNCIESNYNAAWNGGGWDNPSNPHLDRDDMTGRGPENMNMESPMLTGDSYYTIGVHNFSHANRPTATVRVYCNGTKILNPSATLPTKNKSFWWVVGIKWTETNGCDIVPMNNVGIYPVTN